MEVAVGVDRLDLIALAESEADLRLFAGMQFLTLIALLGPERYPFDVVLRQHGVLHGADLDMDDAVFHCPDRDVLLHGGVGGAGNDFAHRLAAADDRDACVLNFGNDVTAMLANVTGHLIEQNGMYQMILSWKDTDGKRRTKFISTGLSVKGNKKKKSGISVA